MKNLPDWLVVIFGILLVGAGYHAIRTKQARTDAEFDDRSGDSATALGWLWLAMGLGFIVAVMFDIGFLKAAIRFFWENE